MTKKTKVAIYSPYLDTLGGGERYMFTFAEYCLQRGWEVEVFWPEGETIAQAMMRFDINLNGLKLNTKMYKAFTDEASYLDKIKKRFLLGSYDLIFWLSDGSVPNLRAKQNWLHFQVPFQLDGKGFWTQQKLARVQRVICNSKFTKRFIDASFGINSEVIYPPVMIHPFASSVPKEKVILSVGRFDQIMNSKRQDVLIETFKKMVDEGLSDWQLMLIGGQQHNPDELLKLRAMSLNYPIEFLVNAPFEELVSWYQRATFFWHAAGFEIDEENEPQKVEHFGISVVEAMAAGCIPLIYKSGGLKEIIRDKKSGYFWETTEQLEHITKSLMASPEKAAHTVIHAQERALRFSKERFFGEIGERLE